MKIQHWLKILQDRPERRSEVYWQKRSWINDAHTIEGGEPSRRPSYRIGDLLVIYLLGIDRCLAIVRVVATADFDPERVSREGHPGDSERWGWVTEIEPLETCDISSGPDLADLGVSKKSLAQHSHLTLTPERFAKAKSAIKSV